MPPELRLSEEDNTNVVGLAIKMCLMVALFILMCRISNLCSGVLKKVRGGRINEESIN